MTNRPVGFTRCAGLVVEQLGRDRGLHDLTADGGGEIVGIDLGVVLGADEDGVDPPRATIGVVLDRDLALAVGPEERQRAVLADLGQAPSDTVRERDRSRHQLVGLVCWRSRTSFPGRRRRLVVAALRASSAWSTPRAMSGDWPLIAVSVPQVSQSKPRRLSL